MTRLLALLPGGLTEQLLFFPTLETLSKTVDQIDVVVVPQVKAVYQLLPGIHRVISFDFDHRKGLADWSNLFGIVREPEYDVALTPSQDGSLRFFLWLLGIPRRIGYDGGWGTFWLTETVAHAPQQSLQSKQEALLRCLGASLSLSPLRLRYTEADRQWQQRAAGDRPYGVLYEGSAPHQSPQAYPLENWRAVVDGLRDRYPQINLVLLQDDQNQSWVSDLRNQVQELTVLTPQSLGQATALMDHAQWVISTDHPPLYLGVGTQPAVVGLFGPTHPDLKIPHRDRCWGLRADSGNLADIPPIQIIEQLS
ncbi:glycosyltransferase family 9 protein [Lyngbya confervoides]|uniref:Glycosyltransferase n=1 Tax=Lyngbya confervoides BDU141951 TaxID=1574623 RepID=A0ABD4T150_9CYAN|nr:glycosyltransferase family 9 protein [Lyngbya confervoides]MCM1982208.1 hypothetical protein [Lyngbya confervoides BDU141951]